MKFLNKVCIITGGSNGIGKHMVHAFSKEGAKVVNLDILAPEELQAENLDDTSERSDHMGRIEYMNCDLRKPEAIEKAIRYILQKHGQVDYLINNACYSNQGILSECDAEHFNDVLKVGVTAPYLLALGFKEHFSKHASIVNIASTRGLMSQPDTESYSAAKGGILALTHALGISLAHHVRVNSVSPGWIDTTNGTFSHENHQQHSTGRIGRPDDITKMVMFLCSEDAQFITCENIIVDGGMTKQMIYHNDLGWQYSPNGH